MVRRGYRHPWDGAVVNLAIGAISNPLQFDTMPAPYVGFSDATGRTVSNPRVAAGQKTGAFIVAGQSNGANVIDGLYTVLNPAKVDNVSVFDGGMYRYQDPALGCNGQGPSGWGHWLGTCADELIAAGTLDRVIWVPISIGSTTIGHWKSGGQLHRSLIAAARRVEALDLVVSGFIWVQGEGEVGVSQASYAASLADMIGSVRAAGISAPWLIGVSTYHAGVVNAGVNAACQAAPNGIDILAGANTDDLGNAYRQDLGGTFVHFNTTGRGVVATRWKNAIAAALPKLPIMGI